MYVFNDDNQTKLRRFNEHTCLEMLQNWKGTYGSLPSNLHCYKVTSYYCCKWQLAYQMQQTHRSCFWMRKYGVLWAGFQETPSSYPLIHPYSYSTKSSRGDHLQGHTTSRISGTKRNNGERKNKRTEEQPVKEKFWNKDDEELKQIPKVPKVKYDGNNSTTIQTNL